MIRKLAKVLLADHFLYQKLNYIRYLMSGRTARCNYKPVTLSIVSTTRCTLSCDMCPTHSRLVGEDYKWRQTTRSDMTLDLFKDTVDRFREALGVQILGSGEPVLNKDFFNMVEYAKKERRMEVKSFTNGTTIREYMGRILASSLDGLTVSVNSHDASDYARLTGMPPETHAQIIRDTKMLIDEVKKTGKALSVKISFIIDRENYRSMPKMISLARELGPDHTFLCNFLPTPYKGLTPKERVITVDDKPIADLISKAMAGLSGIERKKFSFPVLIDPALAENRCATHFKQLRVDGDGNASSCSMMLLNMQGASSLKDEDIWNGPFFMAMREKFMRGGALEEVCYYCPDNKGVPIA